MKIVLKILLPSISFLLMPFFAQTQILDADNSTIYKNDLAFNQEMISKYRIAEIKCEVFEKEPGKPMITKGVTRTYTFNMEGQKIMKVSTYLNRFQRLDTITIKYSYQNGMLAEERTEIFGTSLIYEYKTDKHGNVTNRKYMKTRSYNDSYSLAKTKTEFINESHYKYYYHDDNRIYKKEFINDVNRVYMTVFYIYDKNDMLIREIKRRAIGGTISSTKYDYNEAGKMTNKVVNTSNDTKKLELVYDDQSNLSQEIYLDKENKFDNYIFAENHHQFSSRVYKDEERNIIFITRYDFKYHSDEFYLPFIEKEKPYDFLDTVATKSFK